MVGRQMFSFRVSGQESDLSLSVSIRRLPTILLACTALVACGKGPETAPGADRVMVTTTVVEPTPWIDSIEALGTARANESVTITAKVNETVVRVNFDSGDVVEAGQVLVDLSGRVELAELEEARVNLREAEQQYRRQRQLADQKLIPASQLDSQRAVRDSAQARLDAIRARLADRVITAPFGGVLGLRQVSPGTVLSPGAPIATLDDISIIKLDFAVPEAFISTLEPGQSVRAASAAWPGEVFEGVVRSLDSRVDPVTRSVTVRAELDNADFKLRPGMLLTVLLAQPPRMAITLPELAITQIGRQAFVFKVEADGVVRQTTVRTGGRRPGLVEIVSGLAAGDRVVVEGTVKLRDGTEIVDRTAEAVDSEATP
ncbi:MAG TPA: efflux transporter periplasmic adaptor subunit [Xanthomonadales bacterium]|nr:efflux transporter periplasmic adaptor subunit [Xanthomonadales bacterium]